MDRLRWRKLCKLDKLLQLLLRALLLSFNWIEGVWVISRRIECATAFKYKWVESTVYAQCMRRMNRHSYTYNFILYLFACGKWFATMICHTVDSENIRWLCAYYWLLSRMYSLPSEKTFRQHSLNTTKQEMPHISLYIRA